MLTRRKFLCLLGGGTASLVGGIQYARWGEPYWLQVNREVIPLSRDRGVPPVRIVQLSDFHSSSIVPLGFIAESIALGLAQKPDVVLLTGDYFTNVLRQGAAFAAVLHRLSAAVPTLACFGNHDGGPWTRACGGNGTLDEARALLETAHITVLHNDSHALVLKGRPFQFVGVGDLWSGMCQPAIAFRRTPPRGDAIRIVLNHNPDAKDLLRPHDWDLVVCGHTHGGQLRLPFLGTPFAPVVDKRYVEGLHRWQDRWLHVNRGVGTLHGLRINCRPQVSVLDIK